MIFIFFYSYNLLFGNILFPFLFLYLKLQSVAAILFFIRVVLVYKDWKGCSMRVVISGYFI